MAFQQAFEFKPRTPPKESQLLASTDEAIPKQAQARRSKVDFVQSFFDRGSAQSLRDQDSVQPSSLEDDKGVDLDVSPNHQNNQRKESLMAAKTSKTESTKQEYGKLIDELELSEMQKHFMHFRWLEQVLWMESKHKKNQLWYYTMRLVAIAGSIIVPVLVSLNIYGAAIFVSLLVAISVAADEFFHFGERRRHYRRTAELLKIQAWQFFQLSGPYQSMPSHGTAYPLFAGKVEKTIRNEVNVNLAEMEGEEKKSEE